MKYEVSATCIFYVENAKDIEQAKEMFDRWVDERKGIQEEMPLLGELWHHNPLVTFSGRGRYKIRECK